MTDTPRELLRIENLCVSVFSHRKEQPIVYGFSLMLHEGETVGIVGESGCGKTTAALSVGRLLPDGFIITGGTVSFAGKELSTFSRSEYLRFLGCDIGFVFQNPMTSLNPLMTVYDQIAERLVLFSQMNRQEIHSRVCSMLREVGLPDTPAFYMQYPHQLSGGMRQRVMIASAIINNPKLIIADEPTTALDPTVQSSILSLLRIVCERNGCALLLISHNLAVIASICSRIAVMYAGKIVEAGETQLILKEPLHPYTQGLIRSIPDPAKKGNPLTSIAGTVDHCHADEMCPFLKRCAFADEYCQSRPVDLCRIADKRLCRCLRTGYRNGNGCS